MSLSNNNNRAARGESGLSSFEKDEAVRGDVVDVASVEAQAPVVDTSWDPYQVWLTRVKQPREKSARTRRQAHDVSEQPSATDLSETARLRALTIVR